MENFLTLQDAANIVTFVAPGYFAIRLYALIYAKHEKDFSQLLVESVAVSLPLVVLANWLWAHVLEQKPAATTTSAAYLVFLLALAAVCGALMAWLRMKWPVRQIAAKLGLGLPDNDFIRSQFARLDKNAVVTLTLKSGEVFSGMPRRGSVYNADSPREYYFNNIAWYNPESGKWDNRPGGIIIDLDEVSYIETPAEHENHKA